MTSVDDQATPREALANVLGALSQAVGDEIVRRVGADSRTMNDAAALTALDQFLDGTTVDGLHEVLSLTPSGAVRLVDRLVGEGLVTREPGADLRSRAIRLTSAGRARGEAVRAARLDYLTMLIARLSDDQVQALRDLLDFVVEQVVTAKTGGAWVCRLCDLKACRRDQGECPVYTTALARVERPTLAAEMATHAEIPRIPGVERRDMLRVGAIVVNVSDTARAGEFWSRALGYSRGENPDLLISPDGRHRLHLDRTDRTHLDLWTSSAEEQSVEVDRLLGLGAKRVPWNYPDDADFVVLADTEGNLFCVTR